MTIALFAAGFLFALSGSGNMAAAKAPYRFAGWLSVTLSGAVMMTLAALEWFQ